MIREPQGAIRKFQLHTIHQRQRGRAKTACLRDPTNHSFFFRRVEISTHGKLSVVQQSIFRAIRVR